MSVSNLLHTLAGQWQGAGVGQYPTIASFEYLETLHFTLDEARPLMHYVQKTHRRDASQADLVPSHWESGFLHLLADNNRTPTSFTP